MITKLARISRLARAILPWRFAAAATPHLSPPPYPVPSQRPLPPPRTLFDHQPRPRTIPRTDSYSTTKSSFSRFSFLPAVFLMGAVGFGSVQLAYADADEEGYTPHSAPPPVSGEDLVTQERKKIEDLLRSRGMQRGSYPPFSVAVKGQKVVVKFNITSSSKVSHIIVDLITHLGLKAAQHGDGSEMLLRAWDSAVARQLTLNPPERMKEVEGGKLEDNFCVLIFESLVGPEYSEIEFIKRGSLSLKELDALVSALRLAGEKDANETSVKNPKSYSFREGNSHGSKRTPSVEKSVSALEAMGVRVYGLDETSGIPADGTIFWENIAGYDQQKREIEDTILLALQNPEVYDDIARGTRCKFESNRPRAVLFEGPPGTGKTSSARVIAKQAGVPLLYVPLEVIMSKYYGESERLLSSVFSLANELPDGAIIFLDEVDSFAVSRDSEMHEATRRILSVILRQIDGFEQEKRVVVIAATNRKEDLDPALISRFDSMIIFDLPDQPTREEIAAQYAKHLKKAELVQFALVTEEMSGRDIRDVCQQAERHWASKLIRGQAPRSVKGEPSLPPIEEYIKCAEERRKALAITVGTRRMSKSLALA
ncbi:spastin isoform X1 [Ananas comosus]|uniref:Spastin isoform X1 n=2 Tax=Ananas comosus TaxID=4615 RepID=A0A6P5F2I3_ANACO|nr:spastin isoform X1 [Ananas comosus]